MLENDVYGNELNLASKLGEDVGCGGETLLTEAAFSRLPAGEVKAERLEATVSDLLITYYRVSIS